MRLGIVTNLTSPTTDYYRSVNPFMRLRSQMVNLTITYLNPETVKWWDGQNAEAKKILTEVDGGGEHLRDALNKLTEYLSQFDLKKVRVWGNGSDFDNAILANCYAAIGSNQPWEFWNNRCYRTLKSLQPQVKLARQGTYHNALDDAKSQATHALQLMG